MDSEAQDASSQDMNMVPPSVPDQIGEQQQTGTEINPAHAFYAHAANLDNGSENGSSQVGSDTIDVDVDMSDNDSAVGGMGTPSSTVSLRSSIYAYIEENGRTYHAYRAGAYHVPNDEAEQERLDLQHHLFRMTMNGSLFMAPVTHPQHILDIATGTGLWAIEAAQEYPSAQVVGTDLSPIQPAYAPPNVQFYIEDVEDDWNFSQKFNLIHGRALLSCFNRPKKVMSNVFSSLASGGYFELHDICFPCKSPDGTTAGTSLEKWQNMMVAGLKNLGGDFEKVKEYKGYMAEAGFVDVVEKRYTWAIGPWVRGRRQKLWGTWWMQNFLEGIEGWTMGIATRGARMSRDEVETLLEGVRADVANWRNVHAYVQMYVVYGRRP